MVVATVMLRYASSTPSTICHGASTVLVRCRRRSAAATKRSYMRQFSHCSFVTRQLVSGSFSSLRKSLRCAFFPRCIQNFRMSAPSSVSMRSKPAIRSSCRSKSAPRLRRYTRSSIGREYHELRNRPMRPFRGRSRQ